MLGAISRKMIEEQRPKKWVNNMNRMNIGFGNLRNMSRMEIKNIVDRWEEERWREEMDGKITLALILECVQS